MSDSWHSMGSGPSGWKAGSVEIGSWLALLVKEIRPLNGFWREKNWRWSKNNLFSWKDVSTTFARLKKKEHHCSIMQGSPVARHSSEATTTLILSPKQITSFLETLDPRSPRASWWLQAQSIGQIPFLTWSQPFCNILHHRVVALSLTVCTSFLLQRLQIHFCSYLLLGASLTMTCLKFFALKYFLVTLACLMLKLCDQ